MAKILNSTVVQSNVEELPKRLIVQFTETDGNGDKTAGQSIINYDDLTSDQKTTFDNFDNLCKSFLSV